MDEQYTIDAALFEAATKQIFWKQLQQALPRLIPGLFVLGFFCALPWTNDPDYTGIFSWLPLLFLAFVLFFIVAQWLLYRKSRRIAAEAIANGFKEPKHYTVSSSSAGLTIKSLEREWCYSWGEFNGAIYSKDFLLLPHPKDGTWSLPRQQLSDDFLTEIRTRVKEQTDLKAQWASIGNARSQIVFVLKIALKVLLSIVVAGFLVLAVVALLSRI